MARSLRTIIIFELAMMAMLSIGCCHPIYLPNRNMSRYLQGKEVVGTWRLTEGSYILLKREHASIPEDAACNIILKPNGVAYFAAVTDDFMGSYNFMAKTGTWTLEHDIEGSSNGKKANVLTIRFQEKGGWWHRQYCFAEEHGKLILWEHYGDPDSYEFIEYTHDA